MYEQKKENIKVRKKREEGGGDKEKTPQHDLCILQMLQGQTMRQKHNKNCSKQHYEFFKIAPGE